MKLKSAAGLEDSDNSGHSDQAQGTLKNPNMTKNLSS